MLNIEALAAGLMKLTMQVNSLLEEKPPHPLPPPPTVLCSHWSLARELYERRFVCVSARAYTLSGSHAWRVLGRLIQGQKPQY